MPAVADYQERRQVVLSGQDLVHAEPVEKHLVEAQTI